MRVDVQYPSDVRYDKQTTRAWENDAQLPGPPPPPSPTPSAPAYTPEKNVSSAAQNQEWPTDRIRDAGKQAGEAFADISESALDSLLANILALKNKVAESREHREPAYAPIEQRIPVDHEQQKPRYK